MPETSSFWRSITRYQRDKVNTVMALRNAIGVALPLALGLLTGAIASGVVVATGALNVSFSDGSDPYLQRAYRMVAASIVVGVAVCAGTLSGHDPVTATVVAALWAFAAGMLVALGNAAPDLGVVSLSTLVIFAHQPLPLDSAVLAGLLAASGGLLQTFLALALWPVRRYRPERQALGDLYLELSRAAAVSTPAVTQAPPASAQSMQAHQTLAPLSGDHSIQAERFFLLLSQAERLRLGLMTLARLEIRILRDCGQTEATAVIGRFFLTTSRILRAIADGVRSGEAVDPAPELLREIDGLSDSVRLECERDSSLGGAMLSDARYQMDAIAGQLRAAQELASHASRSGEANFGLREIRQPWTLRLGGSLATLRANLNVHSSAFRHAVRLAVVIGIGETIGRVLGLNRGYWLPMTIAIVLKPDFTSTFSRGVLRLAGTFAGLVAATLLVHLVPGSAAWQILLVGLGVFVMRAYGPANYGILSAAVTALVVSLLAITGVAPNEVMAARAINTGIGGILALIAYAVWPTWERTRVPEALASMLDGYRDYFRAVRSAYENPQQSFDRGLDRTRVAARLARSNLEASVDRLASEPGTTAETAASLTAILAASHRLIHAVMSLEGGLASSRPVPARVAFLQFANHLELTLYYLASALRGSPLTRAGLPDLREDHHALLASQEPLTERYALVNVETDRITNSVNTLSEELLRWLALQAESREKQLA